MFGRRTASDCSVGILGVGNIGKVHLESARAMRGVSVVAAADTVAANRQYARRRGVESVYEDYDRLLAAESLDAVVVALPPFLHADAVAAAAEQGCDAFVEKPLGRSVSEVDQMLDTAERAGIYVGVDHTLRYLPGVEAVKEAYREGRVGHVPFGAVSRVNYGPFQRPPATRDFPDWHLDPNAAGGGVLVELGIHLFDVVDWLFGDVRVVAAETDSQLALDVEDTATVLCRSESTGTHVTLHCGAYQWEDLDEFNMSLRLEGVTGTLDYDEFAPSNFYANAARSGLRNVAKRILGERPDYYAPTYYLQAHYRALQAFIEAVDAGEEPPVSGDEGRRTLELVAAAYDAAETDAVPLEVA
ncbi:Gfo/Idh/MocA family protein [Halorientalis litorea]|jgi:myo-inositol 2-dehydrogenase/D-chiro-inositol 1-dehydrogenase|uniref:Gfo/Idh/MocA family protein n=1 Tax=Halorientalis litorea TaxID=2931977 RepID=UPI001FF2E903|nr:Gfo/Idh/MocA family oxidoreductase [Halorientalis litorea]